MNTFRLLLRITRPLTLIFAALLYALGVGIARYLGAFLDGSLILTGLLWVLLTQLGALFLIEYHTAFIKLITPKRNDDAPATLSPSAALVVAAACLTVVASLTVVLIRLSGWRPGAFLLLLLTFLGAFFYAAPPRRLAALGYGELVITILLVNFVPALAFLLHGDESLRLVAMSTFPLTPLCLASILIRDFATYATDIKTGRTTLLTRMGWQRGMAMHNVLVLTAFILIGLAAVMGMPFAIIAPTFLLIPLAAWQVWTMIRIAAGAKPNWPSMQFVAQLLAGMIAYLFTYGFWIR
jgi:1,4-dihydroxy-2-naphthoate octaprenyltransferase